jgi:Protein of unknown function (DUF1569)
MRQSELFPGGGPSLGREMNRRCERDSLAQAVVVRMIVIIVPGEKGCVVDGSKRSEGFMSATTPATAGPVDTGKITARRKLRFDSVEQVLADVDRLVEAERGGRLGHVGNWGLGQALGHLAAWAEYAYAGYPMNPPFFIKWILRSRKQKFIHEPMRAGVKIPGTPGGTLATEPLPLDEALGRYQRVMTRLKSEAPTLVHPIFGPLTHDEWIAINLRHAELHLGFQMPK